VLRGTVVALDLGRSARHGEGSDRSNQELAVTDTTVIDVPFADAEVLTLRINLGACRLRVSAGTDGSWVSGSYDDPTGELPLRVDRGTGRVTITQDRTFAGTVGLVRGAPSCELRLGTTQPFSLELVTGASDVDLDLGGVPLSGLDVRAGAGRLELRVDRPNPVEAGDVALRVGAGALEATGLGNLAAARIDAESGAAGVVLDLTGELRRRLDVRISSGMSGVTVTVPSDRPARITTAATLGGTDVGDGFRTAEGAVFTAVEGDPIVTVHATVALGGLQLRTAR
jgi:hypothetical protein